MGWIRLLLVCSIETSANEWEDLFVCVECDEFVECVVVLSVMSLLKC